MGKQVKYQGRKEEEIIFADWIGSSQTVLLVYSPCYNSGHLAATLCMHFSWCRDQQAQPRKTSDLGLCVLKRLLILSLTCTLEALTWENADLDSFFSLISPMISFLETPVLFLNYLHGESESCSVALCDPVNCISPWNLPGQNTGVGSCSIFPTQGFNPGLLHCRLILYQLSTREAQLHVFVLKYSLKVVFNFLI